MDVTADQTTSLNTTTAVTAVCILSAISFIIFCTLTIHLCCKRRLREKKVVSVQSFAREKGHSRTVSLPNFTRLPDPKPPPKTAPPPRPTTEDFFFKAKPPLHHAGLMAPGLTRADSGWKYTTILENGILVDSVPGHLSRTVSPIMPQIVSTHPRKYAPVAKPVRGQMSGVPSSVSRWI